MSLNSTFAFRFRSATRASAAVMLVMAILSIPGCGGDGSEWAGVTGRGTLESFCLFHRAYFPGFEGEVPYNVAVVRLAEGARLFTNIIGVSNDRLRIGMPVEACFDPVTPEVTLVKFKPAGAPVTRKVE